MVVTRRNAVEDIILQALGHSERRNIIEIVGTSGGGASYSEILGEIGLNTGKMNYHLKLLEGVIERNKERRYVLTPIGKKAFMVLNSLTEDLENGYEEYLGDVKLGQGTGIIQIANIWFILFAIGSFSAIAGVWMFIKTSISVGKTSSFSYNYVWVLLFVTFIGLVLIRKWSKRRAESGQELFDRVIGKLSKR